MRRPLADRKPVSDTRTPPPPFVAEALTRALDTLGSYPLALGLPELRAGRDLALEAAERALLERSMPQPSPVRDLTSPRPPLA
jgi:hypothetical protein